jgi:hypothetical protein
MKKFFLMLIAILCTGNLCLAQQPQEQSVQAQQRSAGPGTSTVSRFEGGEFTVGRKGITITKIELKNASKCTPNIWITKNNRGYEQNFRNFHPPKSIVGFRITKPGTYYLRPSVDHHSAAGGCPTSTVVMFFTEP